MPSTTKKKMWLDAWSDPMAGIKSFSSCVCLADLFADGDSKLVVGDAEQKLKIFKGTNLSTEHALLATPVAVCTFFSDVQQPRTPSIAVAAGPSVYIYRNLRPYFKFTLPAMEISPQENDIWRGLTNGSKGISEAIQLLVQMRAQDLLISTQSIELMALSNPHFQAEYVERHPEVPIIQVSTINCMATIKKNLHEWDALSCLILGTADNQILILDKRGAAIKVACTLPATPAHIAVMGLFDVEYRLAIACRNAKIYTMKNGELMRRVIELESQVCGLQIMEKNIYAGCMNKSFHSFHIKGKKNWSMNLPDNIMCMSLMELKRSKDSKGVLLAFDTGVVQLYNEKILVSEISTGRSITGMCFGAYGREDASLVVVHNNGGVTVKILQRNAFFDLSSSDSGPPPEQDIPLNVPRKTKLYVEQTQREREQAVDMHRIFQRDLCKIRLATAKSYVRVMSEGQMRGGGGQVSGTSNVHIRLNASVQGIGPMFKIKLSLQNASPVSAMNVPITFHFDHDLYRLDRTLLWIPLLLPGVEYRKEIEIESLSPSGAAGNVHVFVCDQESCIPMVCADLVMPISEGPLEL